MNTKPCPPCVTGALLRPGDAPYLFLMLNDLSLTLQLAVGFGVGLAVP